MSKQQQTVWVVYDEWDGYNYSGGVLGVFSTRAADEAFAKRERPYAGWAKDDKPPWDTHTLIAACDIDAPEKCVVYDAYSGEEAM